MTTLSDKLLQPTVRPDVVKDCCAIIDRQVRGKKGLSGIAIKTAYRTVKTLSRGFVSGVVDALLDEWVDKLAEFEHEHRGNGQNGTLTGYLIEERRRVAEALISVTDERAKTTKHKTAKRFYLRLRPKALTNVETAIPDLAQMVDKYKDVEVVPAEAARATGSEG